MPFATASLLVQARSSGDDRLAVVEAAEGVLLIVADGAGGAVGGAQAASFVVNGVLAALSMAPLCSIQPSRILSTIDGELVHSSHGGQSTAVVAVVTEGGIRGASVGDSSALVVNESGVADLTERQVRKPLLGDGAAEPVSFSTGPLTGTLLLASDGLVKYAPIQQLADIAWRPDLEAIPRALVDLVRVRSGELQDDVAVVVCRRRVHR